MSFQGLVLAAAFALPVQSPGAPTQTPGAKAQTPGDLAAVLRPIREEHDVPAIAAAIVKSSGVVAIGADGVRRRGSEKKVTVDDRFHLGSCTKSMTATMIATLVEDKELAWTTTIGETFPDLAKSMHESWKGVTLEQLLVHRAGAPANLDDDGLWGRLWERAGTPTDQRRELVEGVVRREPESEPGTKFVYSNAGYAIAGAMAETATGEAWEDLMRKRIFAPLGMKSAGFGAPGKAGKLGEPLGHTAKGDPVAVGPGSDNPPAIGPAGTVHATLGDWAKYAALHLDGARGAPRLLELASFAKLHAPTQGKGQEYAMGWGRGDRDWTKSPVLGHSGSNTMWYCTVTLAPEDDVAILVAVNQGGEAGRKACAAAEAALAREALRER